jgi:16S rRNA G966 N2-methylase RsmD
MIAKKFRIKFMLPVFVVGCMSFSCNLYHNTLQERESAFREKEIRKQFNEEYPTYKVSLVLLKQLNEKEQSAMIFYDKPEAKGSFSVNWKYLNKDENLVNYKKEWILIEKGKEGQLAVRGNPTELSNFNFAR